MKSRLQAILFSAAVALAGFSATVFTACKEDKCKGIVCAYGGVCQDGRCLCPSGYEGPQCETINRDRYKGTWQVAEDGTVSSESLYPISIENGVEMTDLTIKSLYNNALGGNVKAKIKGDTLIIPSQIVNEYTIMGEGMLMDDLYYGQHGRLEVRYRVTNITTGVVDDFGLVNGQMSLWHK